MEQAVTEVCLCLPARAYVRQNQIAKVFAIHHHRHGIIIIIPLQIVGCIPIFLHRLRQHTLALTTQPIGVTLEMPQPVARHVSLHIFYQSLINLFMIFTSP